MGTQIISGIVAISILYSNLSFGQSNPSQNGENSQNETMRVVFSPEDYRFRSESTAPVLIYGPAFFQRFEPESVGDILKRIPGISGNADAGSFDQPQLRGLGPQYTQITLNGKRIPGSENQHTLFVDRIPAHLVARIEVVRSHTSDLDAQGIGGTINIVLKDGFKSNALNLLVGGAQYDDGKNRGQAHINYGFNGPRIKFSLDASVQNPHQPKRQNAILTDINGETTRKDERNVFDSRETGLRFGGALHLSTNSTLRGQFYSLATERDEIEDTAFFQRGQFMEGTFDHAFIQQENHTGSLQYQFQNESFGLFQLELDLSKLHLDNQTNAGIFDGQGSERDAFETDQTKDQEFKLRLFSQHGLGQSRLKLGFDLQQKRREARRQLFELEEEAFVLSDASGVFDISEDRLDPYMLFDWQRGIRHHFQSGLRLETTQMDLVGAKIERNRKDWFPSIHYRFKANSRESYRFSLARSIRRPDFLELQPFERLEQPRDDDITLGNPALKPELAWGLDVSYDYGFKNQEGLVGVNLFYRHLDDLIMTEQIGEDLFQPINTAHGKTYGLELDFGFPLEFLKRPYINMNGNLTLQHSEREDALTQAPVRFNGQSDFVANLGILHHLKALNASYGINWFSQGNSQERFFSEMADISYSDILDFNFEKTWASQLALRFSGHNLLEGKRDEILSEFDGLRNQSDVTTITRESETSVRSYRLTMRWTF